MQDLIFLSLEDWDHIWRRNQFVCATLARRHPDMKILFVGLPRHTAQHLRSLNLDPLLTNPTRQLEDFPNITVTTPLRLAPDKTAWGLRVNQNLYRRHIAVVARQLGLCNPLLWINPHSAYHLVDAVPHAGVIYDITDDWTTLTQKDLDRQRTIAADRLLCQRADAVIVCSEKLHDLKRDLVAPDKLHLIPNGVDAAHYASVLQPGPVPENLRSLRGPVFGYTGTLHPDRIDLALLTGTAAILPHATFALIGPSFFSPEERAQLLSAKNIHLLPALPYEKIPLAMRAFDVSITPHKVTPFTESLNPIKLFEYLAAGKPIVSTHVAGFRDHPTHVRLARTPQEFAAALTDALHEAQSPYAAKAAAARQSEARRHSWDNRVNHIERVMLSTETLRHKAKSNLVSL